MGLPYRLRPVDLLAGVETDREFLAVNPAGFIPAIRDGDVPMRNKSRHEGMGGQGGQSMTALAIN